MKPPNTHRAAKRTLVSALVLVTLTVSAPAHAASSGGGLGHQIWQTINNWIHPKPQVPAAPPEKIGPLNDSETEGTPSAAFIEALVKSPRYTKMLKRDKRLMALLTNDQALKLESQPAGYQEHVITGPSLGFLYGEESGVSEGYTVAQHTERVLSVYAEQKKFWPIERLKLNSSIRNIDVLMKWTLAFHDIGKSFAARAGDKSHETIYSCPIASDLMLTAGFTREENLLSDALIWSHQILGNYVRGLIADDTVTGTDDPERAALIGIRAAAKHARVSNQDFFQLMMVVMTSDAGSYPGLRDHVFHTDETGKLISNSQENLDHLATLL